MSLVGIGTLTYTYHIKKGHDLIYACVCTLVCVCTAVGVGGVCPWVHLWRLRVMLEVFLYHGLLLLETVFTQPEAHDFREPRRPKRSLDLPVSAPWYWGHKHTQSCSLLYGYWRFKRMFPCLHSKYSYPLSHLLRLQGTGFKVIQKM